MDEKKLYVEMLGNFSLVYDGKPVTLERSSGTKATQLLQYLLYHKGESIPRDKLIELLYRNDDITNPQNNLKVNMFRLRRLLEASHLPPHDYIVHKNGMYSWNSDFDIVIDAKLFAKKAQDASDFRLGEEVRRSYLQEAAQLYTGEFLPMLAAEPWVAVESVRYKDIYLACVNDAYDMMENSGEHEGALRLVNAAVKIYPFDEDLHIKRISSLLNLYRYQEAMAAYDGASRLFFEELGISPSERMLEIYRRITGNIRHSTALIEDVVDSLKKNIRSDGAYYCNFPSFTDVFLFVSRLVERSGQSVYLVLSTLTDTQGTPLELGDKLNEAAAELNNAIFASLRSSDIYTRYSPCQFLILLIGINMENCDLVTHRVSETFKNNSGSRGIRIKHNYLSALDVYFSGKEEKSGGIINIDSYLEQQEQ